MSFDKSAIQQVQETGNAPVFLEQLNKAQFPVAALPESYMVHDLEKYQPQRNQFRGVMSTSHIDEFIRYHQEYQVEGNQCYIDAERMYAITIFDLGTQAKPGHCHHKAKIQLRKTAAFRALLEVNEAKLSQKKLAEWIEDYAEFVEVFSTDGEKMDTPVASAAIRNMKFEAKAGRESSVDDFSQHQSEYESVAVRTKEEFPMPAVFKFKCEPYSGLDDRTFEMRMSTIGNEILLLRIKKLEQHEEEMGEEFLELLNQKFDDEDIAIDTFIGTFNS